MRPRQALTGSSAVIGVARRFAGEEILPLDGAAQRIEARAKRRQPRLAIPYTSSKVRPNRSSRDRRTRSCGRLG
jgi:hypothetical protein